MTGINHVLTGAAIGLAVQNPWLAAPLALASHFVLDAIPHFDHEHYHWGSRWFWHIMITDGLVSLGALGLLVWLLPMYAVPILTGAAFAILPDLTLLYYYLRHRPRHWIFRLHLGMQWFERPAGALVEASYLVLISTVLLTR